jgi:acetyl esterase/lipase
MPDNSNRRRSLIRPMVAGTAVAICFLGVAAPSVGAATSSSSVTTTTQAKETHTYPHVTTSTTLGDLQHNPAFVGFGDYILPSENPTEVNAMQPAPIGILHVAAPELKSWEPQTMVDGLNFLIDQINTGEQVWYPLYTDKQIAADPSKKAAGMWYFPGDPDKPLAVVAAGGAFRSVASIQEGFPYAQKLHELGYNVAVLKYRVNPSSNAGGGGQSDATTTTGPGSATTTSTLPQAQRDAQKNTAVKRASADLVAAMNILKKKGVSFDDYSVWGSSAGGELMTAWASKGAKANGYKQPTVVVGAYTPPEQIKVSKSFGPYFATDAADDPMVSPAAVVDNINKLKAAGADVKFVQFPTGGHGFGLGTGTPAAGWLDQAVAFWQAHMKG